MSFESYVDRWDLVLDGEPLVTRASRILPVRRHDVPAMLKVSTKADECQSHVLMRWWDGDGAARVLAFDGDALLLERAMSSVSLADMARTGRDEEASRIICAVAGRLHSPRSTPLPDLISLTTWFRELTPAAARHGGILTRCADAARELLADQREIGALHGDLHHENVLDFGARGWLAIDPKCLVGERTFDFANLFTNPDLCDATVPVATVPGRMARQLAIVSDAAGLDPRRLLLWILAWTGLSAAWFIGEGIVPTVDLIVAEQAAAELDR